MGTVDINSLRRVGHHWKVKFRFNIIFPSTAKFYKCRRRQEAMIALRSKLSSLTIASCDAGGLAYRK